MWLIAALMWTTGAVMIALALTGENQAALIALGAGVIASSVPLMAAERKRRACGSCCGSQGASRDGAESAT
ncbi:MAG: hypothetical protein SFY95_09405 [Planctomycetota bacterium]|nr:hypothetical protein [Planctomycetota bacterium]